MKELLNDGKRFLKRKEYWVSILITAILGYGYLWMHSSMGVDDTCVARYFVDGFAPTQGRWTLFLLNKVFHIAEYTPFVIDVIGVLFLAVAALVFCLIFERLSEGRLYTFDYVVFSCVFLSYPLITEVYVYYLHNGLGLAYMLSAFAVYIVMAWNGQRRIWAAGIALAVAFSCYESLAMVYLLGIFLCVFIEGVFQNKRMTVKGVLKEVLIACIPVVVALMVRSIVSALIMVVMGVDKKIEHSIFSSLYAIFRGDFIKKLEEMVRVFGRYYVVNALANYSIALYWICVLLFAVVNIFFIIKRKNAVFLLISAGVLVSPWLLSVIEMTAEPYRTMQTLAVFCGFCLMLLVHIFFIKGRKWQRYTAIMLSMVVLYNQVFLLNKWFYVDYLKYQEDLDRASKIAYDIEKYATLEKPVVFIGEVRESGIVKKYAYLNPESMEYRAVSWAYEKLGIGTPDDYSTEQNLVWYSLFDWGIDAFEEPSVELSHFFQYHGFMLKEPEASMREEAERYSSELTVWPQEGSVREYDSYVIVKLGEVSQ